MPLATLRPSTNCKPAHAEVQLPSVHPLSLPSEEQMIIIIIIIIIIDIIQRPTPVFQAKIKQSENSKCEVDSF